MKYEANGNIIVYGGKFFKITYSVSDGTAADNLSLLKEMTSDTEMNPSFVKFETEDELGYIKENKEGKLSFTYAVDAGDKNVTMQEGIPYDLSPDKFTDYSAEDVKVMYQAAKATIAK